MTKIDLQRVLDLDEQATEGPWEAFEDYVVAERIGVAEVGCAADAELIAHYRTAAPAMAKALQAVLEIHKPFHADHYYNGMDGESLHRFVLRCDGCEESGGIENYPCPTVKAIHHHPTAVLIPSAITQEKFDEIVETTRNILDPPGISGAQHLTTKHVERIAELVLQGVGIEVNT